MRKDELTSEAYYWMRSGKELPVIVKIRLAPLMIITVCDGMTSMALPDAEFDGPILPPVNWMADRNDDSYEAAGIGYDGDF